MKRTLAAAGTLLLAGGLLATGGTAAAAPTGDPALAPAARVLSERPDAVRASADDTFAVTRSATDSGGAHVRYDRTYRGLRVVGGDVIIHTTSTGAFRSASVGLSAPLSLDTTPAVNVAQARKAAQAAFKGEITRTGAPDLLVDATSGVGRLAWETVVEGWAPDGQTPSKLHVLTDAATGALIRSYDEIMHVSGTGNSIYVGTVTIDTTQSGSSYSMTDPAHGNGYTCDMNNGTSSCTTFTDSDNVWGNGSQSNDQSAGVDAHYGAAKTFDYFKNVHGRNGIFGNGTGVPSRVHYGNNYVNAFWDGSRMTYGDGSSNAKPLVSLDVAGHEMSHGVTEAVAGLVYSGESGGLNEATSDIFGNMVEFYAANSADPGDYLVGEKIDIHGNGTPLRYMYNPSLDGSSHSCWSTSTKNVDVHYSSGVGNHFYFNLAEGTGATAYGTSPVCGSAPAVTGIGRTKAEKIWFRALDTYFTSSTSYVNTSNPNNTARHYTLQAATDLYGNCSTEYKAVQAAWTAVNVAGNDAACGGGGGTTVWSDDFESSTGWTTDPNGTDTATTGMWERGNPEQVNYNGAKQLGTTVSGSNDLVTGRLAGSSAGSYDIDSGVTSVRSPAIALPSSGTLNLSLSWYLAHASNSSSADYFRVSIIHNGGTTTLFTQNGAASDRDAAWAVGTWNISSYAGQSVRILIEAADASGASLVEAGVDDVVITKS